MKWNEIILNQNVILVITDRIIYIKFWYKYSEFQFNSTFFEF